MDPHAPDRPGSDAPELKFLARLIAYEIRSAIDCDECTVDEAPAHPKVAEMATSRMGHLQRRPSRKGSGSDPLLIRMQS